MKSLIFVGMQQPQPSIQEILNQIETGARNEFDQLADIGAEFYSTADLLRLRGKWEEANVTFQQLHKVLLYLGFSSPLWILLSLPIGLFGLERLAYFTLAFFPITFILFTVGSYLLKRRYNSRGYLEFIGSIINDELRKRSIEQRVSRRRR